MERFRRVARVATSGNAMLPRALLLVVTGVLMATSSPVGDQAPPPTEPLTSVDFGVFNVVRSSSTCFSTDSAREMAQTLSTQLSSENVSNMGDVRDVVLSAVQRSELGHVWVVEVHNRSEANHARAASNLEAGYGCRVQVLFGGDLFVGVYRRVTCEIPTAEESVERVFPMKPVSSVKEGEWFTAQCAADYQHINGDTTRKCLANGLFSGRPLVCREWHVRLIGHASPGEGIVEVRQSGAALWTAWTAVCADEWDDADAEVVCRSLGMETLAARCVAATLFDERRASVIGLGAVRCSGEEGALSDCTYQRTQHCAGGQRAAVSCVVTCDIPPASQAVNRIFPPPSHVTIEMGQTLMTSCGVGYESDGGNATRQCLESAELAGQPHNCRAICTVPWLPASVMQLIPQPPATTLFVDETFVTTCAPEHRWSNGSFTRQCLADGSLAEDELVCILDECPIPALGEFTRLVSPTDHVLMANQMIVTECAEHHQRISGNESRRCQEGGVLEGEALQCVPVTCDITSASESVSRATHLIAKSTLLVDEWLMTSCAVGYKSAGGDFNRQCLASGILSGTPIDCQATCAIPRLHASVVQQIPIPGQSATWMFVGTSLVRTCVTDYRRSAGAFLRQCLADGSLAGDELVCIPDECSIPLLNAFVRRVSPPAIDHSLMVNQAFVAECVENYQRHSGDSRRRCQSGGALEGEPLVCKPGERLNAVIIGGYNGQFIDDAYLYRSAESRFQRLPDMIARREFVGAANVDGRTFAVGGRSEYKAGHLAVNTGEAFDHRASTWTSIASMAVKRSQHALAAIGYQLYAIAGRDENDIPLSSAEIYDTINDTWTAASMADFPDRRFGLKAAAIANCIYAVGGVVDGSTVATGYRYCTADQHQWCHN